MNKIEMMKRGEKNVMPQKGDCGEMVEIKFLRNRSIRGTQSPSGRVALERSRGAPPSPAGEKGKPPEMQVGCWATWRQDEGLRI